MPFSCCGKRSSQWKSSQHETSYYIDETAVYLWSVEDIDVKTNILVEYVAES